MDNERDDVTEVSVFDVERSAPHTDPETRHERNGREQWQQENLPARHKLIPDHKGHENSKADEKIHERNHHRCDRNDLAGEVYLADEIGIADEAVRGIDHCRGKETPR